jgi:Na+-driven multidrug efflux pump
MINKLLVKEKSIIVKHPMFILSICFIVYFIMGIVVEAFFVYTLPFTELFKINIIYIIYVLNLIINFIYAFVFLLMPAKKNNNFKQVQYV